MNIMDRLFGKNKKDAEKPPYDLLSREYIQKWLEKDLKAESSFRTAEMQKDLLKKQPIVQIHGTDTATGGFTINANTNINFGSYSINTAIKYSNRQLARNSVFNPYDDWMLYEDPPE